jgi:hypothetical protein
MRTGSPKVAVITSTVCALLTLATPARAEDSHAGSATIRAGSSVGFSELSHHRWSTLGAHLAAGYRLGPIQLEAEYDSTRLLYYTGTTNRLRGEEDRLGAALRWYVTNLAVLSSDNSKFRLFVDVAVGRQRGQLEGLVFSRNDFGGGGGWLLEHRVQRPGSGVRTIGWHLGWRLTASERGSEAMARVVCGKKCGPASMPPPSRRSDLSLNLGSSLSLSW